MQNHTKMRFIEYSDTQIFWFGMKKEKGNFLIHVSDERSVNIDGSKTNIRARSTHDPICKREINGLWIIAYYNLNIIFEDETYDNGVIVSLFLLTIGTKNISVRIKLLSISTTDIHLF